VFDVWRWFSLYVPVRVVGGLKRLFKPGPKIAFVPSPARPWYLIWNVAIWSGIKLVTDPSKAKLVFRFEDKTYAEARPEFKDAVNGQCLDLSKTRVAEAFESVFGYALSLDPETHQGPAVEKGEDNGAHDGRIVTCPSERQVGKCYQRLIDNVERATNLATDLRTPFVNGQPIVVYIKQRPKDLRFANMNSKVGLTTPDAVFSPQEIDKLSQFAKALSLDWGGMDILRNHIDGRLYVVDVNKTDMGPPLALAWHLKMRSVRQLSKALKLLYNGMVK
jgi:hypothetical protein